MFVPRINTERHMAIWNGFPGWFTGSTNNVDLMDEQSDAYVKQLKAGYDLANQQANQQWCDVGNQTAAMQNWNYQATSVYPTTTVGTGLVTTTMPQYYPTTQYPGGSIYASTGQSYGFPYNPSVGPAAVPQSPKVGDKMVMEWDGMNWNTRYEPALSGPKVA